MLDILSVRCYPFAYFGYCSNLILFPVNHSVGFGAWRADDRLVDRPPQSYGSFGGGRRTTNKLGNFSERHWRVCRYGQGMLLKFTLCNNLSSRSMDVVPAKTPIRGSLQVLRQKDLTTKEFLPYNSVMKVCDPHCAQASHDVLVCAFLPAQVAVACRLTIPPHLA